MSALWISVGVVVAEVVVATATNVRDAVANRALRPDIPIYLNK